MNRKVLTIAFIVLFAGIGFFYMKHRDADTARNPNAPTTSPSASGQISPEFGNEQSSASQTMSPAGKNLDPRQFCNRDPACADDPTIPNSENELRWMQQHGYPTREEIDRLAKLSEVELAEEVKRGNLTAMSELGTRMVDRGDNNGLSLYLQAANSGSIYSYYAESNAQMKRSVGGGLVEAGAYLRLAYMLGDYKAATTLYRFVESQKLSIIEMNAIDRRAASLYITYAKNRQPTPRPFE